jgi:hypothetical protein
MHYLVGVMTRYRAAPSVEKEGETSPLQTDSIDEAPKNSAGAGENALNIC